MFDIDKIEKIYFVGIAGIGMSALAEYFVVSGIKVAGYDRNRNDVTDRLESLGCGITTDDNVTGIPEGFRKKGEEMLVVFTPAIPLENRILGYFRDNDYEICKRSELLGELSIRTDSVAIAGTHGKTTVSTMTTHILKCSGVDATAFLGGVSKNYGSNYIGGSANLTVMEADEYDRSFHRLSPKYAVVTSADADHLDIYGDIENMLNAYSFFCGKIRENGVLVLNAGVRDRIVLPSGRAIYTYGVEEEADYAALNVRFNSGIYRFDMKIPGEVIKGIEFCFPGKTNLLNFVGAAALSLQCGGNEEGIRMAASSFTGVKRRFDIRLDMPGLTYVDDYAHHPEEIKSCIESLLGYFGSRRITGIFQPHLFSRTADHAEGFARVLDLLDEVILLPIYPAREKPVPGVTSQIILDKMKLENKRLLSKEELVEQLEVSSLDVIVTIGAGDIDTLVKPIEEKLKKERRA